jgi:hypothetical protein
MLKSLAIALVVTGSAVAAQTQAPASAPPAAAPAPAANAAKPAANKSDLDRVVCEEQDEIGSRLKSHKVCMTVAQWQEFRHDVQDQMRRVETLGQVSH